jgi:hypothetical protein
MILKYLSKFVLEILPSVVATIIGAYIVNHYITKPANAPVVAAVSTVDPKTADPKKTDAKDAETPSDVASAPEPGTAKKSTPDKASIDKASIDKASIDKASIDKASIDKASIDKASVEDAAEKSTDKPTQAASLPVEPRRHQPAPHDRTVGKAVSVPVQTPTPAVAAASIVPPLEASPPQEERRDANDMARAAIERLRRSTEASRAPEAPRVQDPPRIVSAPAQPVQPLPPPIMVSTPPSGDGHNPNATVSLRPPFARVDDPRRPTPPADIPTASPPMDLHTEATASTPAHLTVAQDVLSAAKSVLHAVLPH